MQSILGYDRLEDALVVRLNDLNGLGYSVSVFPELETEQQRAVGFTPRITVAYAGSNYGDRGEAQTPLTRTLGATSQMEHVSMIVSFEGQRLRGNSGLYEAVRLATKLLLGFQLRGWTRLTFRTNEFQRHVDGVYTFYLTVSCSRALAQAVTELGQTLDVSGQPTDAPYPNLVEVETVTTC